MQAPRNDEEIADDPDRQRRRRHGRSMQARGVEEDHADDHRQHMPATKAAGMAAARRDITVETSSITIIANACAFGSCFPSSVTMR